MKILFVEKLPDEMKAEVFSEIASVEGIIRKVLAIRLVDEDSGNVVDKKSGYKSLSEAKAAIDKYYKPDGKPISVVFLPDMKRYL